MRHRLVLLLLLLPILAGCPVGTTSGGFQPAHGPAGAPISVRYGKHQAVGGELIAVQDSALIIRQDSVFFLVPVRMVRRARVEAPGAGANFGGGEWSDPTRERLRLLSRYPQGLTPALQQQLLDAYGQTALRVLPS